MLEDLDRRAVMSHRTAHSFREGREVPGQQRPLLVRAIACIARPPPAIVRRVISVQAMRSSVVFANHRESQATEINKLNFRLGSKVCSANIGGNSERLSLTKFNVAVILRKAGSLYPLFY